MDDAQEDLDFCLDAGPEARQEDRQLRQPSRLPLLLRRRARHARHDLDDVSVSRLRRAGRQEGAGQIAVTSFSVPARSLDFWKARLRARDIATEDVEPRFGEESIAVSDRSGLRFELVANDRDDRQPWTANGVGAADAIRGLHSVTMVVRSPADTLALMTGLLGFKVVNETEGRIRLAVNGDAPGRTIDIVHDPAAARR